MSVVNNNSERQRLLNKSKPRLRIGFYGKHGTGVTSILRHIKKLPYIPNPYNRMEEDFTIEYTTLMDFKINVKFSDINFDYRHPLWTKLCPNIQPVVDSDIIVLCVNVSDRQSWIDALMMLDRALSQNKTVHFCLTQCDVPISSKPAVGREEIKDITRYIKTHVFETSARAGIGINEMIQLMVDEEIEKVPEFHDWVRSQETIISRSVRALSQSCCCS